MKRLGDNQNHQNRLLTAIRDWWRQAGIGTDLSRMFVLILLALGTGLIFNTVFLWPRQSPPTANQSSAEFNQITMERARQLDQDQQAVIVDTRDPATYAREHIAGAVNLPSTQFDSYYPDFANHVATGETIILYCATECGSKERVARQLQERGYKDLNLMSGGPQQWAAEGYPVASTQDTRRTEGERQ